MKVQYNQGGHYVCNYHVLQQPGVAVCQYLTAEAIDRAVVEAFFAALHPAELDLYQQAMQSRQEQASEIEAAQQRELQRLRYQVDLARRQYDRVDPDNRLVAGELERRWEAALSALHDAEQTMRRERDERGKVIALHVPQRLRESFSQLGQSLPQLWQSPMLRQAQRKALLRCLIDKVVLHRSADRWDVVHVRVVWRGGAVTPIDVPVPVGASNRMSSFDALRDRILELKDQGLSDAQIAQILTQEGFRSPRAANLSEHVVKHIRLNSGHRCTDQSASPPRVPGALTIRQLAEALEVRPQWLYSCIKRGEIDAIRDETTKLYVLPDRPETLASLQQLKDRRLNRRIGRAHKEHQGE